MTASTLKPVRRSIVPRADDDWASIAARELPAMDAEAAQSALQSWNLHLFMRPTPQSGPRQGNPILPSDVVFLEPPLDSPAGAPAADA